MNVLTVPELLHIGRHFMWFVAETQQETRKNLPQRIKTRKPTKLQGLRVFLCSDCVMQTLTVHSMNKGSEGMPLKTRKDLENTILMIYCKNAYFSVSKCFFEKTAKNVENRTFLCYTTFILSGRSIYRKVHNLETGGRCKRRLDIKIKTLRGENNDKKRNIRISGVVLDADAAAGIRAGRG